MTRSVDEATRAGSSSIEAEHILLAIAAIRKTDTATVLSDGGLAYDIFVDSLRQERVKSLAAAGIGPTNSETLESTSRRGRPAWGASARDVVAEVQRAPGRERSHRPSEVDIAIAILRADLGTVPRALAFAGIDRQRLIAHLHQQ